MKQRRHLLILLFVLLFGFFFIKWLSGEDAWICENNHWIKHGNPTTLIPLTWCDANSDVFFSGMNLSQEITQQPKLTIRTDFVLWGLIPSIYSCQWKDKSPALYFTGYNSSVKTFALTLQDPDAPGGTRDHWVMWNIKTWAQISYGELPKNAILGKNSRWSRIYRGPCPPSGSHQYILTVYALNTWLDLPINARASTIHSAVKWHIVDSATLTWIYTKYK